MSDNGSNDQPVEGFLTGEPVQPLSETPPFVDASPEVQAHVDDVQRNVHETLTAGIGAFNAGLPETITRDAARRHRDQEQRGFVFPLEWTGGVARVRRISMARLATFTGLSPSLQALVLEVFQETQDRRGLRAVPTWPDLKRNVERQEFLANGLCIAGFLMPRLVESEAEADGANDPSILWVEEIDIRDRLAYFNMLSDVGAAKALEPFPEERVVGSRDSGAMPASEVAVGSPASP